MRTREKGYVDYGLTREEAKKILEWCKKPDFEENVLLLECAKKAHYYIFNDIYFSLVKGLSYEKIDQKSYQELGKEDFYGHRRKTLALFRDALKEKNKYPFGEVVNCKV